MRAHRGRPAVHYIGPGRKGMKDVWNLLASLSPLDPGQDAPHMVDGLLHHETDLQTDVYYSNTWGYAVM